MALGESGRLPLCCDYFLRSIKYWCKLLMMPPHRYPKQCYIMLRNQDDMGRTNWATAVKSLLYRYGFGLVWLSQDFGNMNLFIMQFKQRLVDCYKQEWSNNVHGSSRCDTYKHFKTILEPEKYLSFEIPHSHIKALARFRCSNHKFAIETGRHNNIPKTDRICAFCLEKQTLDV